MKPSNSTCCIRRAWLPFIDLRRCVFDKQPLFLAHGYLSAGQGCTGRASGIQNLHDPEHGGFCQVRYGLLPEVMMHGALLQLLRKAVDAGKVQPPLGVGQVHGFQSLGQGGADLVLNPAGA